MHIDYSFKKVDRNTESSGKGVYFCKERCHVSMLVGRGVRVVIRKKETPKMFNRGQGVQE